MPGDAATAPSRSGRLFGPLVPALTPAVAAQILASVELASACSSWMGVRKLFPPGKEKKVRDSRQEGVLPLREGPELSSDGHSLLSGSRQALWCRSRARAVATGASRPRPRPRTVASWGPVGRQACEGGSAQEGPSEARQVLPPTPSPIPGWRSSLTPGGFCGGCGGLPGGPGPGSSGLGGGVPVWGALGLPGRCVWGGPVLTDGVGTPVGWPQCALSCQGAADGQGAGQAGAPTPPLSVDNAWEFSSGPPRNLSLGRTPAASCRSPGHAAPHMGSFWSTCTLTM